MASSPRRSASPKAAMNALLKKLGGRAIQQHVLQGFPASNPSPIPVRHSRRLGHGQFPKIEVKGSLPLEWLARNIKESVP